MKQILIQVVGPENEILPLELDANVTFEDLSIIVETQVKPDLKHFFENQSSRFEFRLIEDSIFI